MTRRPNKVRQCSARIGKDRCQRPSDHPDAHRSEYTDEHGGSRIHSWFGQEAFGDHALEQTSKEDA